MSAVILQDEIVHYEVLGRGRPLLFLHTWVGSWRYWISSMQAASLAFRAYALDLWGFGDSAKNPAKYTLSEQVSLLNDFLDKMGIAKIALVGHGWGALVGLQFAQTYSSLVDRIMVIGAPGDASAIHPRLRADPPVELADWLLSKTPGSEAARAEASKAEADAVAASLACLETFNLVSTIQSLTVPCLLVHGSNDPVVSGPDWDLLPELPACTHSIVFEQSGHFPMLDENSKFSRLLMDFLALPSGESPQQLQLKEEWKRRVR